jgi:hypothetical protein
MCHCREHHRHCQLPEKIIVLSSFFAVAGLSAFRIIK